MHDFVTALNAVKLTVWLVLLGLTVLFLSYARYRKEPATGSLVDMINSISIANYGFILCMAAIGLIMANKDQAGDKIFLSGASFIGGVGVGAAAAKRNQTPPNPGPTDWVPVAAAPPPPPPLPQVPPPTTSTPPPEALGQPDHPWWKTNPPMA